MRRLAQSLFLSCFLALPLAAQRGGGHGGMGGGFRGGIGGGGFRGAMVGGFRGGIGGGFRGGGLGGRGFAGPGFRGGFRGVPGNRFFFGFGFPYWWGGGWGGWGGFGGWGWGYPFNPYYPYDPGYPYPYVYSYPSADYGYHAATPPYCPTANGTPLFLIKLTYQDQAWIAQDYWYSPGTLNFVSLQGEVKKTPIDSIDRAATLGLNRDCGVAFQLPR